MEGSHLRGGYYGAADSGQDEFLAATGAEDVLFYDELISGLDDLQAVSGPVDHLSSYGYACMTSEGDVGLEALQHGCGGWTRYPTDDCASGYSPINIDNTTLPSTFFSTDDYAQSLSQPDVQNGITEEFYLRTRSHSEHFDMFGDLSTCDLSTFAQKGREVYSEALGQWNSAEMLSEPKVFDPFCTSVLVQQQEEPVPLSHTSPTHSASELPKIQPKENKPQFCAVIPEKVKPPGKCKPSYSEVAKNGPCGARPDLKEKPHCADVKHRCRKGNPSGSKLYHSQPNVPRASECLHSMKASGLEPTMIKPDSRYGLDTFEEPAYSPRSVGDQTTCSSDNSYHSHNKDNSGSGPGSYSGVEDVHTVQHLNQSDNPEHSLVNPTENACDRQTQCRSDCDARKEKHAPDTETHINVNNTEEEKLQGSSLPGTEVNDSSKQRNVTVGDSAKKPDGSTGGQSSCPKVQGTEHVFFDPKRIFNTRPQTRRSDSTSASTKGYVPASVNSEKVHKSKQHDPDGILNNDKPSTKSNSNISKSCYINNNLREPSRTSKKQENANAQRESVSAGEHSRVSSHATSGHRPSHTNSTHNHVKTETIASHKRDVSTKMKCTKSKWDQQPFIGEMVILLYHWTVWITEELGQVIWNVTKLIISIGLALLMTLGQSSFVTINHIWITFSAKAFAYRYKSEDDHKTKKLFSHKGLKENIILPSTGEEAMDRLLANKGKDPYSILGVRSDASDEVIKKYYRRQAVLVHPDKNQIPGAEEAFKILGHAFDLIGEPEKRKQFDAQTLESQEEEEAFYQFADLLNKLHEKMQEAANTMRCENCGGKHRRFPTERPLYSARYCQKCGYNHSVREGDVWAESHMLGFRWNYYACMEGKVYDITEWASCQADRFKHIQANSHNIAYRIATQSNTSGARHRHNRSNEAELEDFLNQLFNHSSDLGKGAPASDGANSRQFGSSHTSAKSTNVPPGKKTRRRKKRH